MDAIGDKNVAKNGVLKKSPPGGILLHADLNQQQTSVSDLPTSNGCPTDFSTQSKFTSSLTSYTQETSPDLNLDILMSNVSSESQLSVADCKVPESSNYAGVAVLKLQIKELINSQFQDKEETELPSLNRAINASTSHGESSDDESFVAVDQSSKPLLSDSEIDLLDKVKKVETTADVRTMFVTKLKIVPNEYTPHFLAAKNINFNQRRINRRRLNRDYRECATKCTLLLFGCFFGFCVCYLLLLTFGADILISNNHSQNVQEIANSTTLTDEWNIDDAFEKASNIWDLTASTELQATTENNEYPNATATETDAAMTNEQYFRY